MNLGTYAQKFEQPALFKGNNNRAAEIQKFEGHGIKVFKNGKLVIADGEMLGILLAHIPTSDLHALYKKCEGARSFSRLFHYLVKTHTV